MRRGQIAGVVVGVVAAVAWCGSGFAVAKEASLKELMGENFAGLQNILFALIASNYAAVPSQVAVIHDHADKLTHTVPESAKQNRDQFLAYAYNLKTHAADLKSIAEVLIEHDKARPSGEVLPTDQLREAAAAHYGGMVTMCVACHNRFRQRVIQ
jgi:cytochrome c556